MRFLVRWAIRLFIIAVVLVVALVLLKDTLLKAFAENRIRAQTGMDTRIGRFEARFSNPAVTIEDLKLYNTAEFGGAPFLDIPELHLEYDLKAFAERKLRFKLVRFNLHELNMVESKDGRTNIFVIQEQLEKSAKANGGRTNDMSDFEFGGIDLLNLTIGKAKFTSLKNPRKNTEFDVGLNHEILPNVKSMDDLSGLVLKIVFRKGISFFSGHPATLMQRLPAPPSASTNAVKPPARNPPVHAPPRK